MIKSRAWCILAALTISFVTVSPAVADYYGAPPPTRGIVGVKAGFISGANFKTWRKLRTKPGATGGVFVDIPILPRFYIGGSIDLHNMVLVHDQALMIDIGLTFKEHFPLSRSRMILVPTASVGYAYLSEVNIYEKTEYLNLKLYLETHFKINTKRSWVGDVGASYMPVGGNGAYDIEIGPTFFIRWGLAFR